MSSSQLCDLQRGRRLTRLLSSNLRTAPGQRQFAFEKLNYRLEEEFGCGIRPAVKAAPRSILGQSPSPDPGAFFHVLP